MPLGEDVHSYSNFSEAVITHIYPHLTIDFQRQILFGYTNLTFEKLKDNVKSVRLDTKGLAIERVEDVKASDLPWTIPQTHAALGKCLEVDITTIKDKTFVIRIHYCTSKELSGGIQWFEPVQTLDKKHPFMYTQFEAILARTMIPCQDTPSVKAPYDIDITCPSPLVCACSGAQVGSAEPVKLYGGEWLKYTFQQKMPIPAYLIALACGGIQRQAIGTRCGVWAEPSLLKKAADEFSDTEEFLTTAAKIAGLPYEPLWGHYDLLVLPGAFPYGGMENPCLTFISSSLITGDKALVDVVAHEIAHSWSGNLVTNSGWPDFWINEGFTMYLERLILGEKHNEQLRHFHILLGYQDLQKTMSEFKDAPNFTKLVPDMEGIDPDDAFSRVPYEKGCSLLVHLEQLVGGKDKMIPWLRKYFSDFSKKSVTSTQVINHFESFFPGVKVDWNTWLHGTFMPAGFDPLAFLDTSLFNQCKALSEKWKAGGAGASADDIKWDSAMTMCFIDILINEEAKLSSDVLGKMNEAYKLSETNNVELMIRWIMLNLQNENLGFIMPTLEDFVSKHGRGVYVKPIYSTLIRLSNSGKIPKDHVQTIYKRNRSFYHSVIRNAFDAQLN